MKLYKVMSPEGFAQNKGVFDYNPYFPKEDGSPGDWTPRIENLIFCYAGYHVTPYPNMWINSDQDLIFEVEVDGLQIHNNIGTIDKYVCKSIRLLKQIKYKYDNNQNSGNLNSGHRNSGNLNSGNLNSGHRNSGNLNSGDGNSGYKNSGNRNSGDWNSGDGNSGYLNSGDGNSGYRNSGSWNSGNRNSGDGNSGYRNSGDGNSGYRNSGYLNSGDGNSGNWNSCNSETGYLNSKKSETIRVFNQPCAIQLWEKAVIPKFMYFTLKNDYKQSFIDAFNNTTKEDVELLLKLPNFDYSVFEEISGITQKMIEEKLNGTNS